MVGRYALSAGGCSRKRQRLHQVGQIAPPPLRSQGAGRGDAGREDQHRAGRGRPDVHIGRPQ
eukprot:548871-Alexandrium_andersonii.AAC.1